MPQIVIFSLWVLAVGSAEEAVHDSASLLQQQYLQPSAQAPPEQAERVSSKPFVIGLRRESVPIYRQGKVASFKTTYSGVLNVGTPAQEFRVVFDTGSGNIVLPAGECKSEACLVEHRRRFNSTASATAVAVNADGSKVPRGAKCDQVTIGFGTGEITGEFTRDRVCFGSAFASPEAEHPSNAGDLISLAGVGESLSSSEPEELCVEMSVILAVEMSSQPFKTFRFDGILGLALDGLAMNKQFSAFEMIMGTGLPERHFGVFLSEGEEGEESEIAFGGVDQRRLLEPLSWASVAMPELGYWQVPIVAVRIDGEELDVCKDGTCRGVVDTGTSHLGVPAPYDAEIADLLTRDAGDTLDCRLMEGSQIEIELPGYTVTLHPFNYMRRLPLREGVSVSSAQGVYAPSAETNATLGHRSSADPVGPATESEGETASAIGEVNSSTNISTQANEPELRRYCRPRLMPVRLPAPLGPKLFILGEPVLHRYYTVYDWAHRRVGFSLANNRWNTMDFSQLTDRRGTLPEEVDMLLMQQHTTLRAHQSRGQEGQIQHEETVVLVQVRLRLTVRAGKRASRRVWLEKEGVGTSHDVGHRALPHIK